MAALLAALSAAPVLAYDTGGRDESCSNPEESRSDFRAEGFHLVQTFLRYEDGIYLGLEWRFRIMRRMKKPMSVNARKATTIPMA